MSSPLRYPNVTPTTTPHLPPQYTQQSKRWTLVGNGTWAIQTVLRRCAKDNDVALSASWSKYYNIRSEVARSLGRSAAFSDLSGCLVAVGADSTGAAPTPGSESALAIGQAVLKLQEKGHTFSKPIAWDPDAAIPDAAPVAAVSVAGRCLRMRGVPYNADEAAVRDFFSGFEVDKVVVSYDTMLGKPKGEAYARMTTEEEASRAVAERNTQMLGSRYIELFSVPTEEMDEAAKLADEVENNTSLVLRLRGIPYSASESQIETFFASNGVTIDPASIHIQIGMDGRPSGCAFVRSSTEDDLQRALKLRMAYMGSRYVELYRATESELTRSLMHSRGESTLQRGGGGGGGMGVGGGYGGGQQMGVPGAPNSDCIVRLRGLPFQANEHDIASFFAGLNIAAQGIHLVYNSDNRPSGEAFVEFQSEVDVTGALEKDRYAEAVFLSLTQSTLSFFLLSSHSLSHRMRLGPRYVEIFVSSRVEMLGGGDMSMQHGGYGQSRMSPYGAPPPYGGKGGRSGGYGGGYGNGGYGGGKGYGGGGGYGGKGHMAGASGGPGYSRDRYQ